MLLDDLAKNYAGIHEEAQAKLEADFSEFCPALTTAANKGFAQAQADLERQRGGAAG